MLITWNTPLKINYTDHISYRSWEKLKLKILNYCNNQLFTKQRIHLNYTFKK